MADTVKEVQKAVNKVYKNGKTLAENFQSGLFVSPKALKMDKEMKELVKDKFKELDTKMDLILSKISK